MRKIGISPNTSNIVVSLLQYNILCIVLLLSFLFLIVLSFMPVDMRALCGHNASLGTKDTALLSALFKKRFELQAI